MVTNMGIKVMHSVVIILSILLALFFSYYMANSDISNAMIFAISGVSVTFALVYYLWSILKKFKTI
tara:strand:+ start:1073 stop:1270 length:198 start_codon:yes stop_codon:yes gene_type:complete